MTFFSNEELTLRFYSGNDSVLSYTVKFCGLSPIQLTNNSGTGTAREIFVD